MTAPELADCWVPVPVRWRHLAPGDVFVAPDGRLWHLVGITPERGQLVAGAMHGEEYARRPVDPDDVIPVLVPTPERDAVELTREQLGARLVERRTTAPPNVRNP